ncbi:hypothetical protein RHGRI_036098 [Rhododendron griersonianum]|uniref:Uncharacterized protein n=1 Tax=Rhododendron griersonianum TaxID=479676 RepID=A0AAV6HPP2_9ERIC|nr:hypothetical protein RHGRI_036098 [Rhododendron griersonianum]
MGTIQDMSRTLLKLARKPETEKFVRVYCWFTIASMTAEALELVDVYVQTAIALIEAAVSAAAVAAVVALIVAAAAAALVVAGENYISCSTVGQLDLPATCLVASGGLMKGLVGQNAFFAEVGTGLKNEDLLCFLSRLTIRSGRKAIWRREIIWEGVVASRSLKRLLLRLPLLPHVLRQPTGHYHQFEGSCSAHAASSEAFAVTWDSLRNWGCGGCTCGIRALDAVNLDVAGVNAAAAIASPLQDEDYRSHGTAVWRFDVVAADGLDMSVQVERMSDWRKQNLTHQKEELLLGCFLAWPASEAPAIPYALDSGIWTGYMTK